MDIGNVSNTLTCISFSNVKGINYFKTIRCKGLEPKRVFDKVNIVESFK